MASAPARVIDRDFLVDIGGWEVLKQAQAMVAAGRVRQVRYQPPVLSAEVDVDGRTLTTRLKATPKLVDVENLCTCRQAREDGTICAHVVAAGWAWMESQRRASEAATRIGAAAAATTAKPAAKPTWPRHLLGNHPDNATPLELFVLLPLDLPAAVASGSMRMIVEARADRPKTPPGIAGARPWDALPRDDAHHYAVTEEDESLLRWLERTHGGEIPGMSLVKGEQIHGLLRVLRDHPRVMLGKKVAVHVRGLTSRPKLVLEAREEGGMSVRLENLPPLEGQVLRPAGGTWQWRSVEGGEHELSEAFTLAAPYAVLSQGPVDLPPEAVADFLTRELPALSATMEVDQRGGTVRFEPRTPEIHATLDGSLAGVSVRLEAVYGDERFLLTPKFAESAEASSEAIAWRPDPSEALAFWQRDLSAEKRAARDVLAAGFSPGHRSPDQFVLSKERPVADFLANRLPRWRQRWKVRFGSRMQNVWERVEVIRPEVTLRESSGENWLSLDMDVKPTEAGGDVDVAEVRRWLATGQAHRRVPAADGGPDRILLIPTDGWSQLETALADSQVEQQAGGPSRLGTLQAGYLNNVLEAQGWELTARSTWPPAQEATPPLAALPESFASKLRPYQRDGVEWLAGLARHHFAGLLADEMGLGKTIQVLAFLRRLLAARVEKTGSTEPPPALVVAPTSLVENWRAEAERFAPELRTLVLQGPERAERFAAIGEHDVILTSYALLRRDIEKYAKLEFSAAILDEAQHIKNRASQNARSAKAVQARHRFVLTGTPLENSLLDLWSIYDFLLPGYLGTAADFKDSYEGPIAKQGDEAAQERLRHRIQPFFLRRTKTEVIRDLPEKIEQVAWCDLTAEQTQAYTALLEQGRRDVFDASGKAGKTGGRNRLAVLAALLRLRQASCHLGLLPSDDKKEWREPSGKFDLAMELLEEALDGGHRVLVFSQFVKLLGLLRERLDAAGTAYAYLDGGTPTAKRQAEVARFQSTDSDAPPVFLISLKAGGTGLNLTAADTVLHLDPWWNPAVEDQATARAHRIGQNRVVNAYKLIARGTVEEKILHLQEKKRELIAANIANEQVFVESLTNEEMQSLFD